MPTVVMGGQSQPNVVTPLQSLKVILALCSSTQGVVSEQGMMIGGRVKGASGGGRSGTEPPPVLLPTGAPVVELLPTWSGGPSTTAGHGGKVTTRVVVLPSAPSTGMVCGGIDTLGSGRNPQPPVCPAVTFTLETGILSVVTADTVIVTVFVVTTNVVLPSTSDAEPTSREVVYGGMEMVVLDPSGLGAITMTHGGVHAAL